MWRSICFGEHEDLVRELGFGERVGKKEKINVLCQNDADMCVFVSYH